MVPVLAVFAGVGMGLWLMRHERFTWIFVVAVLPNAALLVFGDPGSPDREVHLGRAMDPIVVSMLLVYLGIYAHAVVRLAGPERLQQGVWFAAISYGISLSLWVVGAQWFVETAGVSAFRSTLRLLPVPPLLALVALLLTRPDRQEARDG